MTDAVSGVILAGGLARRMGGGDKCLRMLGGRPLLSHIIERAAPQVAALVLNANGDPARFAAFGLPVAADSVAGFAGPLAGILAGLDWTADHVPQCRYMASFAGDAPFLPRDLVTRFLSAVAADKADLACAASAGQMHPVVGLWRVDMREDLRQALVGEQIHKVDRWTSRYRVAAVEFAVDPVDPFFNANRPEDLESAERFLG